MIKITCHNDNIPERQYIIDVLFSELLEQSKDSYEVVFDQDARDYRIECGDNIAIVEDHFFIRYQEPLSYLDLSHIPSALSFLHTGDNEIPIIFGTDKYEVSSATTQIGLDIFASSFFMLTRWEEYLLGREEKGDCDETLLFAVKHGIWQRPVVHEYESLLRSVLALASPKRKYQVVLSHDVDGFVTPAWSRIFRDFIRQTIHGAPKNKVLHLTWDEEIRYKKSFPSDINQFEFYRSLSTKFNIAEWLYFKVCAKGETECTYTYDSSNASLVLKGLKSFDQKELRLGFHPSQSTFKNKDQWQIESERITRFLGYEPVIGRNHHLLYDSNMLRQWEMLAGQDTSLQLSNCVFHNRQGFRSGISVPYRLFDIYQRRDMRVVEHPCQIMDTVIRYDSKVRSESEIWDEVKSVIERTKQYGGELVLTWHIYIRNSSLINSYFRWCERIIDYATK